MANPNFVIILATQKRRKKPSKYETVYYTNFHYHMPHAIFNISKVSISSK